jgi:superfamily II DNA or RNA helicase
MTELREWQQNAIDKFHQHSSLNFLVSATPGSGKTTFALALGQQLLDAGVARRLAAVVPTDILRQQFADAAAEVGISLMPVSDATDYDKAGYQGYVATYAQLARGAGAALARRATQIPTVVFLDEIHHAGESKSWGDGILDAYEYAVKRIGLTGTPWRQSKYQPIPYVLYDLNGVVHVDFAYEYGAAVADRVCRPIEFHAYDGEARWRDCGTVCNTSLGSDMEDDAVSAAMDTILRPDHAWMPTLFSQAAPALDELRCEIPDAGGLVVADTQWQARAYATILARITGEEPTIATSDDPNAKTHIDAYRHASSRWLVTVKMVSEGVDIPRLGIVVYAAKTRTPLFFRQVVGRIVRRRAQDTDFNARMYIPAIPALMIHAAAIENELRHQLEIEIERMREQTKSEAEQGALPLIEPIGSSEAVFDSAIYKGDSITAEEHQAAELHCRAYGIPLGFAVNMAKFVRDQRSHIQATSPALNSETSGRVVPIQPPRWRQEVLLRSKVDSLVGKYAYRTMREKHEVNRMLLNRFPPRKKCSTEQLDEICAYLEELLGDVT